MQARVNPRSTSTKAGSVVLSISMMAMVVCCCPQTGAHFQLPFWRGFCKCKGEEGRVKHKTEGAKGQGTKTYPCFKCHNDMHKGCTILHWILQEDILSLSSIRVSDKLWPLNSLWFDSTWGVAFSFSRLKYTFSRQGGLLHLSHSLPACHVTSLWNIPSTALSCVSNMSFILVCIRQKSRTTRALRSSIYSKEFTFGFPLMKIPLT